MSAIPDTLYKKSQFGEVKKATKALYGPGGTPLTVRGKFTATLSKGGRKTTQEIYVVKSPGTPLLGLPACKALQLIARLDEASLDFRERMKRQFPNLFKGLGKMEGKYNIPLKPGAVPFSLSTPRCIFLPLMPKVMEEVTRMESQEVISKVEEFFCPRTLPEANVIDSGAARWCTVLNG